MASVQELCKSNFGIFKRLLFPTTYSALPSVISNPLADSVERNAWMWLSDAVRSLVFWFSPFSTWPKMLDFALKELGCGCRFCLLSPSPKRWLLVERWDMQPCRRWFHTSLERVIKAHSTLGYFSTLSVCQGERGVMRACGAACLLLMCTLLNIIWILHLHKWGKM